MKTSIVLMICLIVLLNNISLATSSSLEEKIFKKLDQMIKSQRYQEKTPFHKITEESCTQCQSIVTMVRDSLIFGYKKINYRDLLIKVCQKYLGYGETCVALVDNYSEIGADSAISLIFNPKKFCTVIKKCTDPIPYITIDQYAQRVLKDKPKASKEEINPDAPALKLVQVTDMHLDLEYKEGTIVNCGKFICCRDFPPENSTNYTLAGLYGSSGCDGSPEIVKSFANQLPSLNPDIIILNGDHVAHDFYVTIDEVIEANKAVVNAIVEKVGTNISIYPTMGNHEGVPASEFYKKEEKLLTGLGKVFKPFLAEEAYQTFVKYGYYTQLYKNTKLRIVSMNSLICDAFNFHLLHDTSQPKKMFDWLEEVLSKAENNSEKVYIIHHFPMGNSRHSIQCSLRLKILMDRYQNIIYGYFSGHLHREGIGMISEYNSTKPIHVNFIESALNGNGGNPSYRVYEIDSSTMNIKDFTQYRFDLKEANKERKEKWYASYKGSELYNVTYLNDVEGLSKINVEGDYIVKTYTDTDYGKAQAHNENIIKSLSCDLHNDLLEDAMKCKDIKPALNAEYVYYLLSKMMDNWEE